MITLVVLLTCAEHVEEGRRRRGVWFRRLLWLGVASIGLSRLLISSHFLHQVLCGLLFGLAIHRATSRPLLSLLAPSPGPRQGWRLLLAPAMAGLALALFRLWTWLGMDPGFSIPLARRSVVNSVRDFQFSWDSTAGIVPRASGSSSAPLPFSPS
jgi:hypothetical protein